MSVWFAVGLVAGGLAAWVALAAVVALLTGRSIRHAEQRRARPEQAPDDLSGMR